jgi:hypothetical protein
MGPSSDYSSRGLSRRGFLLGTAAGLAAGLPLGYLGLRGWQFLESLRGRPSFTGRPVEDPRPLYAMPGPYPGRVVEVRHPGAVDDDNVLHQPTVEAMIDNGMTALTGADHPHEAWARFFQRGDVVGIKVNPVGRKPKPNEGRVANAVGVISNPEVLIKVVKSLKDVGVKPEDIIVFERYANEFCEAGYDRVMLERDMAGTRWYASSSGYGSGQVDITGFDNGRAGSPPEQAAHVVGYDPDVFVFMGFASPDHDLKDDRRFRSHLSLIVTRMVNKIINLPVLKDHRSAGVTLALKNMSHGMNNNVARSHMGRVKGESMGRVGSTEVPQPGDGSAYLDSATVGPNQCNTFIPTAAAQHPLRRKMTLHILDGLVGVYEGGPGNWNQSWATWRRKSLFFATDPVALDHVGWNVVDARRAAEGWQTVDKMGLLPLTPSVNASTALAALAANGPLEAQTLGVTAQTMLGGRNTEIFDLRQPQHIILAEKLGLGIFDAQKIEHRCLSLTT